MTWKVEFNLYVNEKNELEVSLISGKGINRHCWGVYSFSKVKEANSFLKEYLCFTKRDIKDFWAEELEPEKEAKKKQEK